MAWSPEDSLVIGISSRALFRLDEEDRIYNDQGTLAFIEYERSHEADLPEPGVAFPLVEALLKLNDKLPTSGQPAIEIVIISKNHPDCGIRIRRALRHYKLNIRRAVFTGGQQNLPYLKAFKVDLFLSKEEPAVKEAIAFCKVWPRLYYFFYSLQPTREKQPVHPAITGRIRDPFSQRPQ